jgi:hypothetical protein
MYQGVSQSGREERCSQSQMSQTMCWHRTYQPHFKRYGMVPSSNSNQVLFWECHFQSSTQVPKRLWINNLGVVSPLSPWYWPFHVFLHNSSNAPFQKVWDGPKLKSSAFLGMSFSIIHTGPKEALTLQLGCGITSRPLLLPISLPPQLPICLFYCLIAALFNYLMLWFIFGWHENSRQGTNSGTEERYCGPWARCSGYFRCFLWVYPDLMMRVNLEWFWWLKLFFGHL